MTSARNSSVMPVVSGPDKPLSLFVTRRNGKLHESKSTSLRSPFQLSSFELHIVRRTQTREAFHSTFKHVSSSSFTMFS